VAIIFLPPLARQRGHLLLGEGPKAGASGSGANTNTNTANNNNNTGRRRSHSNGPDGWSRGIGAFAFPLDSYWRPSCAIGAGRLCWRPAAAPASRAEPSLPGAIRAPRTRAKLGRLS